MPVTARLSKLFYDRLGEAVANELVDWFNQVDATYRSDLREINELNFARFDAKVDQRLAELRLELKGEIAGLRADMSSLESRLNAKLETLDSRVQARLDAAMRDQIRFFFLAWAALLVPMIGLWFR